tara:strand:+ start:107 stop:511 length:405 start_codon:yes stop_codon:yes gene_type:complete
MSELNSINGGYKGGSPRVRSENSRKITPLPPQPVNVEGLTNNIKDLYSSGRLTPEDIQSLVAELQQLLGIKITEYSESFLNLKIQKETLNNEIQHLQNNLSETSKSEDLADMVDTISTFFGKDKIEEIRNLLKK